MPPCGGEFSVSLATHHYFAGAALAELSQARADAATEIERAVAPYEARPGPGQEHFFGTMTLASWRGRGSPDRCRRRPRGCSLHRRRSSCFPPDLLPGGPAAVSAARPSPAGAAPEPSHLSPEIVSSLASQNVPHTGGRPGPLIPGNRPLRTITAGSWPKQRPRYGLPAARLSPATRRGPARPVRHKGITASRAISAESAGPDYCCRPAPGAGCWQCSHSSLRTAVHGSGPPGP